VARLAGLPFTMTRGEILAAQIARCRTPHATWLNRLFAVRG
jgi:hypothetical protein